MDQTVKTRRAALQAAIDAKRKGIPCSRKMVDSLFESDRFTTPRLPRPLGTPSCRDGDQCFWHHDGSRSQVKKMMSGPGSHGRSLMASDAPISTPRQSYLRSALYHHSSHGRSLVDSAAPILHPSIHIGDSLSNPRINLSPPSKKPKALKPPSSKTRPNSCDARNLSLPIESRNDPAPGVERLGRRRPASANPGRSSNCISPVGGLDDDAAALP
jgi:hypothetical protein